MTMLHGVINFDACEMSEYKKSFSSWQFLLATQI